MLSDCRDIAAVCQSLAVSEAAFHRWRNRYGGMKADEAKRLKGLEIENRWLKKAVDEDDNTGITGILIGFGILAGTWVITFGVFYYGVRAIADKETNI